MKKFTSQQIDAAFKSVPTPIQEQISSIEMSDIVAGVGERLTLHLDQIGALAELTRNLLLGLMNPQEFSAALLETGLTPQQSTEVAKTINESIFIPLQGKMKAVAAPVISAPNVPPVPLAPAIAKPLPLPPPPANLPGTPLADALAKAGVATAPAPAALPAVPPPLPKLIVPAPAALPHEMRIFRHTPDEPHAAAEASLLPMAMPQAPSVPVPPVIPQPPTPAAPAPAAQKYATDPYREPLE